MTPSPSIEILYTLMNFSTNMASTQVTLSQWHAERRQQVAVLRHLGKHLGQHQLFIYQNDFI